MAEIHVQTKKHSNSAWVWIVLALLIIGAVVYYMMTRNNNNQQQTTPSAAQPAAWRSHPQSRPPRPQRVDIVIPVVYMRSV
ncbi:MAG: hypothetical protein EOO10_00870 [Chitinophagaceae bacterium]|nr:MAG: hypothetical protein EOO10_00870 [Chitinophagaceae bacterium]